MLEVWRIYGEFLGLRSKIPISPVSTEKIFSQERWCWVSMKFIDFFFPQTPPLDHIDSTKPYLGLVHV
jgi:hypothetical protein